MFSAFFLRLQRQNYFLNCCSLFFLFFYFSIGKYFPFAIACNNELNGEKFALLKPNWTFVFRVFFGKKLCSAFFLAIKMKFWKESCAKKTMTVSPDLYEPIRKSNIINPLFSRLRKYFEYEYKLNRIENLITFAATFAHQQIVSLISYLVTFYPNVRIQDFYTRYFRSAYPTQPYHPFRSL